MSAPAPDLIRYLRDCLRADHRGAGLLDLFAKKVDPLHFLPSPEELVSGAYHPASVDRGKFQGLARKAELYRRERNLLYGAFPLIGRPRAAGGRLPKMICAPLFLFRATLREEPDFPEELLALQLDFEDPRINEAALLALLGEEDTDLDQVEALLACLPGTPFGSEQVSEIARLLAELLPEIEPRGFEVFPRILDRKEVRRAIRAARRDGRPRCLAACALALVRRSVETRGIYSELRELPAVERLSRPLGRLLGEPAPVAAGEADPEVPEEVIPAVLSDAQMRALASARRAPLTLLVGPPGTGKSFTLAPLALDHVSRGESVLVAARGAQPLAVIEEKFDQLLGESGLLLRAGRRAHLRRMKNRLEHILAGGQTFGVGLAVSQDYVNDMAKTAERIDSLEAQLIWRGEIEERWSTAELASPEGFWAGLLLRLERRRLRKMLEQKARAWDLLDRYEEALAQRVGLASAILRSRIRNTLDWVLQVHRKELQNFLRVLKAGQSGRQEEIFERTDLRVLLQAFPIWLVRFADLYRVLPLAHELFDLVIVDEATQCDMASCLTALQRGGRLVVAGDPRQLRHVSFLSRQRQEAIGQGYGLERRQLETLDYRSRSLLDLVSDSIEEQAQVVFLDEHYRSAPGIIAFSNRRFYEGSLRIMTRRPDTVERRSVELRRVHGRREREGHNPAEAEAVAEDLVAWVEGEAELPETACHSLGVISPFRAQVEHLQELLAGSLPLAAFEKHRLLVGTPYAFQGQERDAVFLSFAVDAVASGGTFRYLDRADVFNVAITRARSLQRIYHSLTPEQAPPGSLLGELLARVAEPPGEEADAAPPRDAFLEEVETALRDRGCRTWPAYTVAGMVVDLLIEHEGASLGIDLVGYPGLFAPAFELERYRMLRRAGLPVFPLTYFAWCEDWEHCLDSILAAARRRPGRW